MSTLTGTGSGTRSSRNTIKNNIIETIGQTPLVRINRLFTHTQANVFAKLEFFNPLSSVKDRIGASMILAAEAEGILTPRTRVIEPTSGNTGIGLAFVCAARGYSITLTMPDTMSLERRKVLKALGAELVLTPGEKGMAGAIAKAETLSHFDTHSFMPQQFKNPANPEIHRSTTGPEILEAMDNKIDCFVAGVGTGGTITGVGEVLKNLNKSIRVIAVEPEESPVITQTKAGQPLKPGPHKIQGIGAGFIPHILNMDLIDEAVTVSSTEAIDWSRKAMTQEGLMCGISSGAALCAVSKIVTRPELRGKNIVVILPSAAERYLSTPLFKGLE